MSCSATYTATHITPYMALLVCRWHPSSPFLPRLTSPTWNGLSGWCPRLASFAQLRDEVLIMEALARSPACPIQLPTLHTPSSPPHGSSNAQSRGILEAATSHSSPSPLCGDALPPPGHPPTALLPTAQPNSQCHPVKALWALHLHPNNHAQCSTQWWCSPVWHAIAQLIGWFLRYAPHNHHIHGSLHPLSFCQNGPAL